MLALGVALEAWGLKTAGHTGRVVRLAAAVRQALGLDQDALAGLRHGAYLHGVGKLAVPGAVLLKPVALSAEKRRLVRSHSAEGAEIAARVLGLGRGALEVVRHHHEHWDGLGYPDGLRGEGVPLAARVFAICDVCSPWSAPTSAPGRRGRP